MLGNDIIKNVKSKLFDKKVRNEDDIGSYCDHTVLRAYTITDTVEAFCVEAKRYRAASVCVNPIHIALVSRILKGTDIKACAVIGFPLGANRPAVKAFEAKLAVEDGAQEVDMVINIGALREQNYDLVFRDIKGVVDAAGSVAEVKVIIETCYLTDEEIVAASLLAQKAGAHYVKTSTGFGPDGAHEEDIKLIRSVVGDTMKIKASTNVNTKEDALRMIAASADRLGISRLPQIVTGDAEMTTQSILNKPPLRRQGK